MSGWAAKGIMGSGQSAMHGSLDICMGCYSPEANSGDFFAPETELKGPPKKTIEGGVEVKKGSEGLTTSAKNQENVWKWCEEALDIKFDI